MQSEFPIIQSVIENPHLGYIFPFSGGSIIQHKSGFCQILPTQAEISKDIIDVISKEVKESYFHFYDVSAELLKSILEQQPNWNIRLRKRKAAIQVGNTEIQTIPEGYTVSSVLQIHPEQIERIPQNIFQSFYNQWEDFKTQSHAQIIWTEDGSFASMCYGAAFGSGLGEVDVFTDEKHRGKGLGECAVQHFIKSLQQEGKTAHWDCFLDNFGSLALAKKCGFEFNKEYWFLSIYKVT
jgi:RimJ/RimL family protein N-acetyltransferase